MTGPFRSDLQILRGLAILAVWLFHLRADLLPLGFLGVDIFFVISGFLMCGLYDGEKPGSAKAFWLRRAKRILPAYVVVLATTVIAAVALTLPHEFNGILESAAYSIALIPNFGFWIADSYFDKSELKPLLHFWSLGIELQFYLVFPLIVWLHRRNWLGSIALTGTSLLACILVVGISPKTSFFLTPFRIWQFMLGFAVARLKVRPTTTKLLEGKEWMGAAATASLMVLMLVSFQDIQHPKYHALLATSLTVTVIGFGLPRVIAESGVGRMLRILGDYSYSIYLVHFPVIVFWLYRPFHGNDFPAPSLGDAATILAITLALSALLFHAVERPARAITDPRRYLVFQAAMGGLAMAVLVVVSPIKRATISERERPIFETWTDRAVYRCGKLPRLLHPLARSCDLTPDLPATARAFLLVGDSHADSIKETMRGVAASAGVRLWLMTENCPLGRGSCALTSILREIEKRQVDTVVLHSSPDSMQAEEIRMLVKEGEQRHFHVTLVDPVPVWSRSIPQTLYEVVHSSRPEQLPNQSAADYLLRNAAFLNEVSHISEPNFSRYEVVSVFCPASCIYREGESGKLFYFDGGHLTLTGSRRLLPLFRRVFADPQKAQE